MGSTVNLSTFTDHRGSWCSIHRVFICSSVALKKKSSRGNLPALVLHTLMHDEAVEAAEDWENLTSALGSISFLLKSHSSVTWHPTWGFETSTWKSIYAWGFFKINSKCFSLSDEQGTMGVIPCKCGCVIALALGMKEDNTPWGLCTILTQPAQLT